MRVSEGTPGRYEIQAVIGEGGHATVFRVWDSVLCRDVAMKILQPQHADNGELRRRFAAEAQALARLRHPNVVTVYDIGEESRWPFFTMELVEGPALSSLIESGLQFRPTEVVEILAPLCSAVDYVHAAGLIHRDIKASNVMLGRSGRVVLMDFGVARAVDGSGRTRTGVSLGTPETMAPEQVRGLPAGPATDVYALGVLAYQLLAGRPPFAGDTLQLLHAHAYEPPPPVDSKRRDLPEAFCWAIHTALAKDPADRPASAGAFACMLADGLNAGPSVPIGDYQRQSTAVGGTLNRQPFATSEQSGFSGGGRALPASGVSALRAFIGIGGGAALLMGSALVGLLAGIS